MDPVALSSVMSRSLAFLISMRILPCLRVTFSCGGFGDLVCGGGGVDGRVIMRSGTWQRLPCGLRFLFWTKCLSPSKI